MKKTLIALIAIAAIAVTSVSGYLTFGPEGKANADDGSAADAKIQEFESAHSYGRIQDGAIIEYLDKWNIPYSTDTDGTILVEVERTKKSVYYTNDDSRAKSSVKNGLSKHPISDAPEYSFKFTEKQVQQILAAEKKGYGTKVNFSAKKIKKLKAAVAKTNITNIVMGLALTSDLSDDHYGESKTVYELSTANKYLMDETFKAYFADKDNQGEPVGLNRWMVYKNGKFYASQDWLVNIIPEVAQVIEGAEVSVEATYAKENWGLYRADLAQLRICQLSEEPDTRAAIIFRHYFKDGKLMESPAVNVCDRRWETPSKPPKATTIIKKGNPNPSPKPTPNPGPGKTNGDPDANKDKDKPTADKTKRDPNWKPKDESEMPEHRPKDDKGPGEFEPTPKVPKSDTDSVQGSQYQPIAKPQTGGISTTINDLTPQGRVDNGNGTSTETIWRQSEGGQTVTDQYIYDNQSGQVKEFIENAQATTDPIGGYQGNESYTVVKPDDAQNGTNNGEFHMD